MLKKLLVVLAILVASNAFAGGYISGGGTSQADVDKSISEIAYRQTWNLPITYSPNGEAYVGGYYVFGGSSNDFDPLISFGTADNSYAAHFMIVTGAKANDEITITITGDSITDATTVVTGDTDTIVIPSGTVASTYFETSAKWLGQVSIEVTSGTAIICNYGYCKYWDNGNMDFTVTGGEATWMGDVNGATIDLELIHHKTSGWAYGAGGDPTPPASVFKMSDAHGTNVEVNSNQYGAFKRAGGSQLVEGSASEGVMVKFTFSSAACLEYGQVSLQYTQ